MIAFLSSTLLGRLLAAAIGGLALLAVGYGWGRWDGSATCEAHALRVQLATQAARTAAAERARDEYAERLRIDNELDRLNEDRANATPPNDTPCLPADAVERLRGIR